MSRVTEIFSLKIACPISDLSIFLKIYVFYMAAFMRGISAGAGRFFMPGEFPYLLFIMVQISNGFFLYRFAAEIAFTGAEPNF
ncbi:hypothetical protein [Faecalispora jeddahensis]|uniref:hypothetical protein n=1 Tax=Faecalispora jeddahensis TaxID=1414721 RepID=UPI00145A7DCF|nr:hypothetical protein [Faecalispora jeddahensis]